eukprot:763632-Hanusia_phi.AAC.3
MRTEQRAGAERRAGLREGAWNAAAHPMARERAIIFIICESLTQETGKFCPPPLPSEVQVECIPPISTLASCFEAE